MDRLLAEGVWNSVVILREIQAEGYQGAVTVLRQYIAPKRALRPGRAMVRFETKPGVQLQSDWGEVVVQIAGKPTKVHFLVNQLGYSRRFHFWCTDREDAEHTYEGLIRSLEYFGGVPRQVLVDNQKSTVLEHRSGALVRFNERFLDLALQYGFAPRACRPNRARTKGKDERTPALHRTACGAVRCKCGGLHQGPFPRPLSLLRELGAPQPAGRALAGRRGRPAGA